jgi:hypothetical protein
MPIIPLVRDCLVWLTLDRRNGRKDLLADLVSQIAHINELQTQEQSKQPVSSLDTYL